MTNTSEWVSIGHPDKVCDTIAAHILDRHLKTDRQSRVAVEVQLKGQYCTVSGEITSNAQVSEEDIAETVREAVAEIGYTKEYQDLFGAANTICADEIEVVTHLSRQSQDIAQGVDAEGWGDQGIFWGMATKDARHGNMPLDHFIAKRLGRDLYNAAIQRVIPIGIDIKTQISVTDGKITKAIVAAPTLPQCTDVDYRDIRRFISAWLSQWGCGGDFALIFNGTGRYVAHGPIADCGTTGRKLAVDFYGGNCRIGGGCPWGKDPSKADVSLNIYARDLALREMFRTGEEVVYCAISCCIGKRDIDITYLNGRNEEIGHATEMRPAREVIAMLGLRLPVWAFKSREGLFEMPEPTPAPKE